MQVSKLRCPTCTAHVPPHMYCTCTVHVPPHCTAHVPPHLPCLSSTAVLSTLSTDKATEGFPLGSLVELAVDGAGRPLMSTSTLSPHTQVGWLVFGWFVGWLIGWLAGRAGCYCMWPDGGASSVRCDEIASLLEFRVMCVLLHFSVICGHAVL